jgi:hypothetical protein
MSALKPLNVPDHRAAATAINHSVSSYFITHRYSNLFGDHPVLVANSVFTDIESYRRIGAYRMRPVE